MFNERKWPDCVNYRYDGLSRGARSGLEALYEPSNPAALQWLGVRSEHSPPTAGGEPPAESVDLKPTRGYRGNVEILSDTRGIDFGPYLQRILRDIRSNWYNLIPESAK